MLAIVGEKTERTIAGEWTVWNEKFFFYELLSSF
jgi:hypothetical protein